jgi:hypothetical protein
MRAPGNERQNFGEKNPGAAIKQRGKLGTQKRRLSAEIRGQKPAS